MELPIPFDLVIEQLFAVIISRVNIAKLWNQLLISMLIPFQHLMLLLI